jgi:NADH-quinone oxidoreductase subunit J
LPIFFSIAVILANNPIFSLFFLITLFFSSVLLLFSLEVEFLAMIYLIIYIGAISILFLFVIMMFNLKQLQKKKNTLFFWSTIFIYLWAMPKFYFLFATALRDTNLSNYLSTQKTNPYYLIFNQRFDILIFSELFYTYYSYLFLLSGMILLSAMLGSIVLALSTVEN